MGDNWIRVRVVDDEFLPHMFPDLPIHRGLIRSLEELRALVRSHLYDNFIPVHEQRIELTFWTVIVPAPEEDDQAEVEELSEEREVIDPNSPEANKENMEVGLPQNHLEFTVLLEESSVKRGSSPSNGSPSETDRKRSKHSKQSKTLKAEINFPAKIPIKSIALALKGNGAESTGDALRVLDIIPRQQAAQRGCLLVRQTFFHDDVRNFVDVGGGVTACRGFHSSFRTTQSGLSLDMDVSSTMILTPAPVLEFLLINQNVRDPRQIDWLGAKKMLKNLRIKTRHNKMEFKIIGLSDQPCNKQ